jgi:hypothetical protein
LIQANSFSNVYEIFKYFYGKEKKKNCFKILKSVMSMKLKKTKTKTKKTKKKRQTNIVYKLCIFCLIMLYNIVKNPDFNVLNFALKFG